MALNPPSIENNNNNPTKEILASTGIYNGEIYSPTPYATDLPGITAANTGINVTTTTTTTLAPAGPLNNALFVSDLSSGNYYIDDMLVFNKYIHYSSNVMGTITGKVISFDPESFLQQATNTFNAYSLENR